MATPGDVRKLAALARLSLSEAQVEAFAKEFDAIIGYVGQLEKLDRSSLAQVPEHRNVMRADRTPHEAGRYTEQITAQFPARDGDYLSVKQIIQHD